MGSFEWLLESQAKVLASLVRELGCCQWVLVWRQMVMECFLWGLESQEKELECFQ